MLFRFDVRLTDEDYLEYNRFVLIRSTYGKKQMNSFRAVLAVLYCALLIFMLVSGGFTPSAFITAIPVALLFILSLVLWPKFLSETLKWQIKTMKKSGKPGYSPEATLEFYEDSFSETTPENKTEQKYTAIEQVSVVDGKNIYIHINSLMAYILPASSFEDEEQYREFISFIKTKCDRVNIYGS